GRAYPAQYLQYAARPDHHPVRAGHPRRSGAGLCGPRGAAADPELGQDALGQPDDDRHRAACGADPRPHHRPDGARREPPRRRLARPPRPAVEAHAMSLLEIKDLQLSIGPYPILRDVDLTVEPGEVLGIIGESGSGKSMTALTVMQLLPN